MAWFCTAVDVIDRMSDRGVQLRVDDKPSVMASILRRATNTVKLYLLPLYNLADLQADADAQGKVNDLATDIASAYLCERRGNTRPGSVEKSYAEAMKTLEDLREDHAHLDVPLRHTSAPAFSNVRVDPMYVFRKVRVETNISEASSTTPGYSQAVDWWSVRFVEY